MLGRCSSRLACARIVQNVDGDDRGVGTEPERDAWTLIAWMEGTAFYALAGAGAPAPPTADTMRTQLTGLIASMCDPT